MDYKTNALNIQLECAEQVLPDFPSLLFGTIPNGPLVFDSTDFYAKNELQEVDYKVFQRLNKRYIEGIANNANINVSDLFYVNKDGHILIHHELTFLFLAFADPTLAAYFNSLLGEIASEGVAYSDSFVLSLASQRIPTDILQQIINDREQSTKD
jgi:hypothetical protein